MHRCWDIPEIVHEICFCVGQVSHELREEWEFTHQVTSRHALVQLSRTSRRFRHAATEALWYSVSSKYGIEPLLDSVASDLWAFEGQGLTRCRVSWQRLLGAQRFSD